MSNLPSLQSSGEMRRKLEVGAQWPREARKQASTTTEWHITTSTNFTPPLTPQQTHTCTVVEPLLKLAEEDVAGQKD